MDLVVASHACDVDRQRNRVTVSPGLVHRVSSHQDRLRNYKGSRRKLLILVNRICYELAIPFIHCPGQRCPSWRMALNVTRYSDKHPRFLKPMNVSPEMHSSLHHRRVIMSDLVRIDLRVIETAPHSGWNELQFKVWQHLYFQVI